MSRVLIISPEYASHYYPLSAIGSVLAGRGHEVVVATGGGLSHEVDADGMSHVTLRLGPGSNTGMMRLSDQSPSEKAQMSEFFEATRRGMIPTLMHQAEHRLNDLLWEPERVRLAIASILDVVRPNAIVVDHLAFGATAALRSLNAPFLSFHPGHPSAISSDVPYGMVGRIPSPFQVSQDELVSLEQVAQEVVSRFTGEYNAATGDGPSVANPFNAPGPLGLIANYPKALANGSRLPEATMFIGSSVRHVEAVSVRQRQADMPRILVSLGTFFSARTDLLRMLVAAFRDEPVEVLLAHGVTAPTDLGPIPEHWTIAPFLPQPALLASCDLVVTHGGNNTVTEALTAGLPMLVGPLSTDQFSAAADIEAAALGEVFDPNHEPPSLIADKAREILSGDAVANAAAVGRSLRSRPGRVVASDIIEEVIEIDLLSYPRAG